MIKMKKNFFKKKLYIYYFMDIYFDIVCDSTQYKPFFMLI